ncbi:hypothetical protein [Mesorhizobium sp. KR9-304]
MRARFLSSLFGAARLTAWCAQDIAAFAAMGLFLYAAGVWILFGGAS